MESATLTRPDHARRRPLWTLLFVLVPLVILIVSLFLMTARHNAQLMAQAEAHNAQLMLNVFPDLAPLARRRSRSAINESMK